MTHRSVLYEIVIDLSHQSWGISCPLDQTLFGPVQYGWDRFQKDQNSLTFGGGLLAGSPLPGTRRMIFCGYSPQWEGFYVSAMGGAMHVFHRVGANYVWLRGQATQDCVVVIQLKNQEYSVSLEALSPEPIWEGWTDMNGRVWQGFYALQHALYDKYHERYGQDPMRILTVGPAARHTSEGAIGSNAIKDDTITDIDDWAGRGGLGSRLLQYHRVVGIVFGGDWQDPALQEAKELDQYFLDHFGKRAIAADLALSQKYRYMPEFQTGGTFGVNMHTADDRLFSFNYSSIYATAEQRLRQHKHFIVDHYLRQFNEETIAPRKFAHCGEPCAIACKKYQGEHKKDYEPYQALGPNCGIFDQRAAELVNKVIDEMGWDAIQAGGTISWIMELIGEHLIPAADFGLPEERPALHFVSHPDEFDIVKDSEHNALYAVAIANMVLYSSAGEPFRHGMRFAARYLDEHYGIRSVDRAVYIAHGKNGCMVPNQYWVPGMFAPMPLMGKYFSFYNIDYLDPYQLGWKNVERFVYELYSENSGSCRFHRKWIEDIIDDIILSHFDLDFHYWRTNFELAKAIHDYQSEASVCWESERIGDIILGYLEYWEQQQLNTPSLAEWLNRFRSDHLKAARDYWEAMRAGMYAAFAEGISEPPHKEHGHIK